MSTHPIHYSVVHPSRFTRVQLAMRVVAFIALGIAGLSWGGVLVFAYLALPVYAASRLSSGGASSYASDDGPRVLAALRWFAAISAWAGLTAEGLPGRHGVDTVVVDNQAPASHSTPGSALLRVITGLPSALVLAVLCWLGMFVWLWAALSILAREQVGDGARGYLIGLQRWSVRLLAFQASLVDEYPPFGFEDTPPRLPTARVISAG